ncbi:NAD-dependent epimerase/dehydratase family protein [Bacteroidota bacterium]
MKKVLVTGAIGFIGYHLTERLLKEGYEVVGIDNINSYYDVRLKYAKLPILGIEEDSIWPNVPYQSYKHNFFKFIKMDIKDRYNLEKLFKVEKFDIIVNFAAQAGVQYSIHNPHTYIENNITGFINLIDAAKINKIKHFLYASSSSVYGNRDDVPFKETDNVDHPISLYAASKKTNELIAHTYSHLYKLKTTGLRFFTVYGPWGRPDMAPFIFVKRISEGKPITVFNNGNMERDFTYIDDIIDGVFNIVKGNNSVLEIFKIYNIGNSNPTNLNEFIKIIEKSVGQKAQIIYQKMRNGDVKKTFADTSSLANDYKYKPNNSIETGIHNFVEWYNKYYCIK